MTGVDYLGQWRTRTGDPGPAAPATPAGAPRDRPHYGRAILDGEVRRVREAVKGTRNPTLNTAALKCGRAVAGGYVDEDEARAELFAAARAVGLVDDDGPRSVTATISSGLRAGKRTPRDAGEPVPDGTLSPVDVTDQLGGPAPAAATVVRQPEPVRDIADGYLRPGAWLLDRPESPPPLWGEPEAPLWAQGQALMVAALPGLGKSTLAVQLVRARLGLDASVLGLPVIEGKRVLYLCMDRPEQIAGLLMRGLSREEIAEVDDRLVLGWGPPPADVAKRPELLAELCHAAQADTLVVDSLKDAAIKLTDDEVGATYNRARQLAITAGAEVLELHHLVKRNADGKAPGSLADVYGSQHLTAGAGSVLVLVGESGDPVVRALHLKPVREPWGPAWITHDHERGRSTVADRVNLLELLATTTVQTALSAAQRIYETEKPSRAQVEVARRRLEALVKQGLATSTPGRPGGDGGSGATRYHPALSTIRTPWESSTDDDDQ